MFDQSFSPLNFRKIFDLENRAGNNLEGKFFPELEKLSRGLRACVTSFRKLRTLRDKGIISGALYEQAKFKLNERKRSLRAMKDALTAEELEKISDTISRPSFEIDVVSALLPGRRPGFTLRRGNAAGYFCIKQLLANLKTMFEVRQANRQWIVSQLKNLLSDRVPKVVVRTDVKEFFESIDQQRILAKVQEHGLLSQTTKRLLRGLLKKCPGHGLPRGIGVSSVLSEVGVRELDRHIRTLPDLLYYARYVDDIVVVFSRSHLRSKIDYQALVLDQIRQANLSPNLEKTKTLDLPPDQQDFFEYLGYRFSFAGSTLKVGLSDRRLRKYRVRISQSLADYFASAVRDEKAARKLLLQRLRFLSSNTRLLSSKKNVYVGAYFSNPHLTDPREMCSLDFYLQRRLARRGSVALRRKVQAISFERGFLERTFSTFTAHQLKAIGKVWTYA